MSKALDAMRKTLAEMERKKLQVGFFDTAHYPDGTPIAYVASIQEFGHGPIPPRPFMRVAQSQNKEKWLKNLALASKAALDGKIEFMNALEQVGKVAAGDVQKAIKAVTAPPLSPVTLLLRKHKKGADPEKVGGKLVGEYYKKANFMGPQPKQKKADTLAGVSTKPLIDEGLMFQSVTSAVVDK